MILCNCFKMKEWNRFTEKYTRKIHQKNNSQKKRQKLFLKQKQSRLVLVFENLYSIVISNLYGREGDSASEKLFYTDEDKERWWFHV